MRQVLLALALVFIPLISYGAQKLRLMATIYPVYYPLKHMAGDVHQVDLLINAPMDPHHYELKPKDVSRLRQSDYVFMLALEGWERQIEGRIPKEKLIPLYKDMNLIKLKGQVDPHVWVSPKTYKVLVSNIHKKLVEIDPARESHYNAKFREYMSQLERLDSEYEKVLSACKVRVIVTTHLSTGYLARDYRLESAGLRGTHAEEELRPSELKKLIDIMKSRGVKTIFLEPGQNEGIAQRIANQVNAKVMRLNTSFFAEKPDDDYLSIARRNLDNLKKGLECGY